MSEMRHRWVVDSIEADVASIEVGVGQTITIPVALLPAGTKQGDVVRVTLELDAAAKQAALDASAAQVAKGREASGKRDPGGDLAL